MSRTALVTTERSNAEAAPHRSSMVTLVAPRAGDRIEVAGVDYLRVRTPELRRSAAFYARVFGFRVVEASGAHTRPWVLMSSGRFHIAICEQPRNASNPAPLLAWSFLVDDIDRARESIWNLGVVPVRDDTYAQDNGHGRRSFVIRDPGGNEIEIVERAR